MSVRSSRYLPHFLFLLLGVAGACSFQVPKEDDVFSNVDGKGGKKSGGAAGRAGSSAEEVGGGEHGGTGPSNGGSDVGGVTSQAGGAGQQAGGGAAGEASGGAAGEASGGAAGRAGHGGTTGGTGGGAGASQGGAIAGGGKANGGSGGSGGASGSGAFAGGGSTGTGGVAATGGVPGQGGSTINIGLIHYFKFDEAGATTIAANTADPTKNGTYIGCATQSGKVGSAVETRNQYGDQPNWVDLPKALFQGLSATTITLWFLDRTASRRATVAFDFASGHPTHLFMSPDKLNSTTGTAGAQLGGTFNGSMFVNLWFIPTTAGLLVNGGWHHTAVTWDATAIKFYIDGALAGTQPTPGALPSDLDPDAPNALSRSFNLIADPDNPIYTDTPPRIWLYYDELKIYNRVLSDTEIASLYNIL